MEREQESLTEKFVDSILNETNEVAEQTDEVKLEVQPSPVVEDDESFANLASRIVDEVIATRSHSDIAKQVLQRAGIDTGEEISEPQIFNGHLKHVGKRARKVARKQNDSKNLRIRRVKKSRRGPPPNMRRIGAPLETRDRPPLGMEDEVRRSAKSSKNKRGKSRRKRRLFG